LRYSHWSSYHSVFGFFSRGWLYLGLVVLLASPPGYALEPPKGKVLLTIDGNITVSNATVNDQPVAQFDLELLKSLGETTYTTSSPWTVESQFTGVRLNTLLDAVGVNHNASIIRATALNDYRFDLEGLPLDRYPIMVAYEKNDKLLTLRELGPLWIVFPWDLHPELLKSEKNKASSVWQLLSLTVN